MRRDVSDVLLDVFIYTFLFAVTVGTMYPFLNVLAISFNESVDTVRGGITIFPRSWTLENYRLIFSYPGLLTGLKNSILRTVIGTALGVGSAAMLAYVLSRVDFQARRFLSIYLALTLYVSGGLIPVYLLFRDLNLLGTFEVYVLPGLVSAFNVFLVRSFIDGLPFEMQESAMIDGASDFRIFWRIILPLLKPSLATIALFLAVGQWNSWFDTYLFNGSEPSLTTLQFELLKVLQTTQPGGGTNPNDRNVTEQLLRVSPESVKMAITVVVTVPILVVYPFLQRYFVKGLTLGSVKS